MNEPGFWSDGERAKNISKEFNDIDSLILNWENLYRETEDLIEIAKMSEGEEEMGKEVEKRFRELEKQYDRLEFNTLFQGKYDSKNAILSIHAGAGGVEAQDWAEMLLRMYFRFAEKKSWKTRILSETKGSEAGIKSITVNIEGGYAYGWFKGEAGVHRLVRISPFDAEKMRHTSFALVEVLPELETQEVEINPKDLRIDTYLSSGHGGQSVQTTYSAVRIVHIPTGITVACQNERSQLQNKETAMKILRAKLYEYYEKQRETEKQELRGKVLSAEWGSQIRSYVLHPYKMVKDHRTGFQSDEPDKILNGDLDEMIETYLKQKSKS